MKQLPAILTVAGSDSGGGAGIQADLKAITVLGGFGTSVLTALTAQNTQGVDAIHAPPPAFVVQQLKTVLSDIKIAAAKTGMLFSAEIIQAIAPILQKVTFPIVIDPVCVSQSGHKLLQDDAVQSMVDHIFPVATLLTPNIPEAELFTGMTIRTPDDIAVAAKKLLQMGAKTVLIKGGHGMDSVASTDWFATSEGKPLPFMQPRVETSNNHGTGCTLSAAIATFLGHGLDISVAVREAQKYLNLCLRDEISVGEGAGPPNHIAPILKDKQRWPVLDELGRLVREMSLLEGLDSVAARTGLRPALAMPYATGHKDVATLTAPLMSDIGGGIARGGCPAYDADRGAAATLLAARKFREDVHCILALRIEDALLAALDKAGVKVAWFDREDAPQTARRGEDTMLEWGVYHTLSVSKAPQKVGAVADKGEQGAEGGVRILAQDAEEVLRVLRSVIKEMK